MKRRMKIFPLPPRSWSELSWHQLTQMWIIKLRYGSQPDVARAAACLNLLKLQVVQSNRNAQNNTTDPATGEAVYSLQSADGRQCLVTPRQLAYLAKETMPWFDFPYGDPGEKEERDEKGKIIKERREAVRGYVSPMRDAMILPTEKLIVEGTELRAKNEKTGWKRLLPSFSLSKTFSLPQVACNNLTWQQYRSLQAIVPQLFQEGITDKQAVALQAQFLAHCLVPRSFALLDTTGGSIRIRPHWEYKYDAEQAEGLAKWWEKKLLSVKFQPDIRGYMPRRGLLALFHICFQVYQTAVQYYSAVYPLLFQDNGKSDPLRDALTGEVGTINTVMKYAGYTEQQQVYDSNLPFVLDILNTMTKEAKEIEKMNSRIKKK